MKNIQEYSNNLNYKIKTNLKIVKIIAAYFPLHRK